ncbi:MAG: glycosyltransferase involved in cell wall biogenesis [Candidatus Nanosalina sp. J07AB43]|nr:MAG: glycosyltransferase involved in cell wall biogenesis [Candidatus Nanosalina sp. J07AB43]
MDEIHAIIPVSPGESAQVIDNSMKSIQQLEAPSGSRLNVHYVIDSEDTEKDLRLSKTGYYEFNSYFRELKNGTKAGALNYVIEQIDSPDYIAIFDVDSRPSEDFIVKCKETLDSSEDVFLASCPRKILNHEQNLVTKMAGAEFELFNDIQYINDKYNSFNTFNGPISLIDGDYVKNNHFDEQATCEDIEFVQEAYIDGLRTKMTDENLRW